MGQDGKNLEIDIGFTSENLVYYNIASEISE